MLMKRFFCLITVLLCCWGTSHLYSQMRDWEVMYPMINHPVADMGYSSIEGVYEQGLLFALPGSGGGLAYFVHPDSLRIFSIATNLGAVSVTSDDANNRIFCAFGRGSYSDGLYVFDPLTREFELIDWYPYPNFVKKLPSGFYFGYGHDNFGGLIHSPDGAIWTEISQFNGINVTDIEESASGSLFVIAENVLYILFGDETDSYEFPLVINDIYVRNHPYDNEVYVACGDGTDSDAVYRIEYEEGLITGTTFINYFYQPQRIYHYWNYLVVGCNGEYGNLFLVEAEENGQLMQIGTELGIESVYCFEFSPIYTHNFLVSTDTGIYLGTNFEFTNAQDFLEPSSHLHLRNYPNPFNPETTIEFTLSQASVTEISIYDIKGQKIRTLSNNYSTAGKYSVVWDGRDQLGKELPSGIYLYRLTTEKTTISRKMMILK